MTGSLELNDQDVQDLVKAIDWFMPYLVGIEAQDRFASLKERLLKVSVNEF